MMKKAAMALFGLIMAVGIAAPAKANAQVVVRVAPRPYVYVGAPVVYGPGWYAPYYGPRVWVGGRWMYRPHGYRYYYRGYWRR